MLLGLALLSTLNGSDYPCLEQIFIVPMVFEALKFDCTMYSGQEILLTCKVSTNAFIVLISALPCGDNNVLAGVLSSGKYLPAMNCILIGTFTS